MKIKLGVAAVILGLTVLSAENSDVSVVVNMKKAIVKLIGDSQEHDFKINEQRLQIQELKNEIEQLKSELDSANVMLVDAMKLLNDVNPDYSSQEWSRLSDNVNTLKLRMKL